MSADALDDNFELDDGLVADDISGGEEESTQAGPSKRIRVIDEEEEDDLVSGSDAEDEEAAEDAPPAKRAKTKSAASTATTAASTQQQQQTAMSAEEKKKKRKEKQKEAKKARLRPIDEMEANMDTSFISVQPPALQADFMAEMQSEAMPKLSAIEMEDFRIPERYFVDTEHLQQRRDLKLFIKRATKLSEKDFKDAQHKAGSPRLVMVSGAALRVADVVRDLRSLSNNGEVAKLFAKHFKLAEHCTYCEKTQFSLGAGTPDRIQKLIEADALHLDNLTHLVIDLKKDVKKRNLLDIPESRTALFKLLSSPNVNNKLKEGKLKLIMY